MPVETIVRVTLQGITPLRMHYMTDETGRGIENDATRKPVRKDVSRRDKAAEALYRERDSVRDGSDQIGIPARNLKACFRDGGKHVNIPGKRAGRVTSPSKGSLVMSNLKIQEKFIPLRTEDGKLVTEEDWEVYTGFPPNKTTGGRMPCHLPEFEEGWQLVFTLVLEDVSESLMKEVVTVAGKKAGLGPRRPSSPGGNGEDFGQFVIGEWEVLPPGEIA